MNGLYEAVLAMANSSAVLGNAAKQAQEEIETANLVNAVLAKIKEFQGNMDAIERYLQSYIDQHAPGSDARKAMSPGESMAVGQLSQMLDKLKADEATIASEQKLVDQYSQEATNCTNKANAVDQSGWNTFKTFGGNLSDYAHFLAQGLVAAGNAQHHQDLLTDAQNDQMAVLSTKTGEMSNGATALSSKGHDELDQMLQIMRAGFRFLSAIENSERRI
jgi:hypothetical protein